MRAVVFPRRRRYPEVRNLRPGDTVAVFGCGPLTNGIGADRVIDAVGVDAEVELEPAQP